MKAMLLTDMPANCANCRWLHLELWMCLVDEKYRECVIDGRPSWCPLKPLPEKMPMRDEAEFYLGYMNGKTKYLGFNEGYNACLKDILEGE